MAFESYKEYQFYPIKNPLYITLRYVIVIAIYFLFSKDWKSISQILYINRLIDENKSGIVKSATAVSIRVIFVIFNEVLMYAIVICANIGEDRGIGLVVNFSAALIIVEIDDLIMQTGRIQQFRDFYDNLEDESQEIDSDPIKIDLA